MIQTLAPGRYGDTFSLTDFLVADDLSWAGQACTLRVAGWSMFPTLRKGDVLRLLPPEAVRVGDLVLFRHDRTLVCHRVISLPDEDSVRTRGDDVAGDGELVRRADLVGKVAAIVRRGTSIDPRVSQGATALARLGRAVRLRATAVPARIVQAVGGLLRTLLRSPPVRPAARLFVRRSLSYAVGVPGPLHLVRAYRFVELGRHPIDPDAAGAALRAVPSLREAIVLARVGTVPLGTIAVRSGDVQIHRAGVGLGIEETLRSMVKELVALEAARER